MCILNLHYLFFHVWFTPCFCIFTVKLMLFFHHWFHGLDFMDEHPLIYLSIHPFVRSVPAVHVFVLGKTLQENTANNTEKNLSQNQLWNLFYYFLPTKGKNFDFRSRRSLTLKAVRLLQPCSVARKKLPKADKFPVKVIGDNPLVNPNNSLIGVSGLQTYNDIWEWKWNCTFVHFTNCKQKRKAQRSTVCHCVSPYVILGNYPLQIFLLFVTVHADGSLISPTIDSSLAEVWPRVILLDPRPGLRIVLDRAQWLKARKLSHGPPPDLQHSFFSECCC